MPHTVHRVGSALRGRCTVWQCTVCGRVGDVAGVVLDGEAERLRLVARDGLGVGQAEVRVAAEVLLDLGVEGGVGACATNGARWTPQCTEGKAHGVAVGALWCGVWSVPRGTMVSSSR